MSYYCSTHQEKGGWKVDSIPTGYITLRDAHLGDQACDLFETWAVWECHCDLIVKRLKKLERQIPGVGGKTHVAGGMTIVLLWLTVLDIRMKKIKVNTT